MMDLNDIIDILSEKVNGSFILHRSMKQHPKFKVYKIFSYDLYYMNNNKRTLLFNFTETRNAPSEELMNIWYDCDKLYLRGLLDWILSEQYKALCNGI